MTKYRAWFPQDPEPYDFPLEAPMAPAAASEFVQSIESIDAEDLVAKPLEVHTRDEFGTFERCFVTAEKTVHVWGYPEDAASPSAASESSAS